MKQIVLAIACGGWFSFLVGFVIGSRWAAREAGVTEKLCDEYRGIILDLARKLRGRGIEL